MSRLFTLLLPLLAGRPSVVEESPSPRETEVRSDREEHCETIQVYSVISSETTLETYWRFVHSKLPAEPGLERLRFEVLVEQHADQAHSTEFIESAGSGELQVKMSGWCGAACFTVEGTPEQPVPTIWISPAQTWITENPYDLVKTQMIFQHEFHHFTQWRDDVEGARTMMQDSVRVQTGITDEQHCRFRLEAEVDAYLEVCTGELARQFPEAVPGECGRKPFTKEGIADALISRVPAAIFAACL